MLFAMGVTQHCGGSDTSTSICNCCCDRELSNGRGLALIRCAGITMCRARATSARCRMFFRLSEGGCAEIRGKFEAEWGVTLPITTGLDNRQMITAIHEGKLQEAVHQGRGHDHLRCQRERCWRSAAQGRFPDRAGHLFSPRLPLCGSGFAGVPLAGKGWNIRQHGAPDPAVVQGDGAARRVEAGLADHSTHREAHGRRGGWDYKHPSEVMDEVARLTPTLAGVTYERLEGYKTLQWPVAKDGTDQPLLYTREVSVSRTARRRSGRWSMFRPVEGGECDLRSAPEQRAPAGACSSRAV